MNIRAGFASQQIVTAVAALVLGHVLLASVARAQVPPPAQMCGDGTTFTVNLPGTSLGIDDTEGIFRSINVPAVGPPDSVTIPNGCRLYVLLVSGYGQNEDFDRTTFFKVAEFAAKNNGYVHVAWWNNLLAPYMERVLHPVTITITRFFFFDIDVPPNPGGFDAIQLQANLFPNNFVDLPKANPDEDFQFQSDAALIIQAIKANNPNAIIVVAGHSMGADSVARLGRNPNVPIDLLAVIDAGNNRDKPRGISGTPQFNWTRWRATHEFLGYRQADCIRNPSFPAFCRDFDPRPFRIERRCEPLGRPANTPTGWLDKPPLIGSLRPLLCAGPIVHQGIRHTIGNNVKHLYHRWQHEFLFPFDFLQTERFNYPAPLSTNILDPNYQQPILRNVLFEGDPNKTCANVLAFDPRRGDPFHCGPFDGHGEIVGMRAPQNDLFNPLADLELLGLGMRGNWPTDAAGRRAKMIEMATADQSWPHRPENPDLCMVCDDIIAITQHLLDQQAPPAQDTTPPVTIATANPGPNDNGWNNDDVQITLAAADEAGGSGVKEIEFSLSGAQFGGAVQAGASAETLISTEGTTTVAFFARDNAGNVETEKSRTVSLDKTPPSIEAVPSPAPNDFGWNKTDVTVTFTASDALSGLAQLSPMVPVLVTAEGADQEIIGTATDLADNQSSAAAVVSLDKTAPALTGAPDRGPDSNGWYNRLLTVTWSCTDALSGVQSFSTLSHYNGPDSTGASVSGDCFDLAQNKTSATVKFQFDATPPGITITTPPDGASYLINAAVTSAYACSDNLSGVASCIGPVASGAAIDTATVNDKQFTVNSNDVAANHATRTHSYSVHYDYIGSFSPVQALPMVNVVRAGQTVPFKYRLQDANGVPISDLSSFVSLQSAPVACTDSSFTGSGGEEAEMTGRTTLRYDPTANQFVINWQTSRSWSGCRVLQLTLTDGTEHLALFQFK